jgi:hypothetical protein
MLRFRKRSLHEWRIEHQRAPPVMPFPALASGIGASIQALI